MRKALLTTIALAGVGAVSPAGANTIYLGWSDSSTPLTTLQTTSTPGVAVSTATLDSFKSNVITGSDFAALDLGATSSDFALGGTAPIYLYISETGVSSGGSKQTFYIGLSEGSLAKGWSVTESAYLDVANTPYGTGTLLGSDTFTGKTPGSTSFTVTEPISSPYSVTEEIAITPGSVKGGDLSTVSITTVPETSTWMMMALGFAGLGYAALRRTDRSRPAVEAI
jgi:hypothetical protein